MDAVRLQRLLDVGRTLVGVLDPELVLQRLLEVARELTGARYAAIGVLDESRSGVERFITAGVDAVAAHAIGDPPRGRGVLGVLIKEPHPLRLDDVSAHPDSYGFPPNHPPMHAFLGVPIRIGEHVWGNLYLTEKAGATRFSSDDEEAAVVLADWAAIAIDNARLYRSVRERRDELERTIRGLETTTEISRALGGETDLERVLELVVARTQALLGARTATIVLADGTVGAVAGEAAARADEFSAVGGVGGGSAGGVAVGGGASAGGVASGGGGPATAALGEPALSAAVTFRNRPLGSLHVYGGPFGDEDERLLRAFAASAAIAMTTAQHAGEQALRRSLEASEAERSRWARELHDDTLQQLAGLRMLLAVARRSGDRERIDGALEAALDQLTTGIGDLRSLIADLRPAALDELGLAPALETLVGRSEAEVDLSVDLAARPSPELESTLYRVAQEALTNVGKHAAAARVSVVVHEVGDAIELVVRDDGAGFDPHRRSTGFGLVGMRERLALVHGTLDITTAPEAAPHCAPASRTRNRTALRAAAPRLTPTRPSPRTAPSRCLVPPHFARAGRRPSPRPAAPPRRLLPRPAAPVAPPLRRAAPRHPCGFPAALTARPTDLDGDPRT